MIIQYIITEAIYTSLQDREHQPVINPLYQQYGLDQLNFILDEWRDKIPFPQLLTFTSATELQNTVFQSVSNVSYVLNTVQMPMRQVNLTQFIEIQNVLGLIGVPEVWYWDEVNRTIQIYPGPSNPVYSFTVWGRISNAPFQLTDTVPIGLPSFMVNALIFQLAWRLSTQFGRPWSDDKEKTRLELINLLTKKKSITLVPQRTSVFGRPDSGGVPPFPLWFYMSGGR